MFYKSNLFFIMTSDVIYVWNDKEEEIVGKIKLEQDAKNIKITDDLYFIYKK
jgi:hypothetical protein